MTVVRTRPSVTKRVMESVVAWSGPTAAHRIGFWVCVTAALLFGGALHVAASHLYKERHIDSASTPVDVPNQPDNTAITLSP